MPTIAIVDGVSIRMFYNDHDPPHFHAVAGQNELIVGIAALDVIRGVLPPASQRRVLIWAREQQGALALNWLRCREGLPSERI
jgi:hypothetical protein